MSDLNELPRRIVRQAEQVIRDCLTETEVAAIQVMYLASPDEWYDIISSSIEVRVLRVLDTYVTPSGQFPANYNWEKYYVPLVELSCNLRDQETFERVLF